MKKLLYLYSLIVCFLISGCQSNTDLEHRLQGEWLYANVRKCPDLIFFHKNGCYIIWNECGSHLYRLVPVAEKGNWTIKNKTIILYNRKFFSNASNFIKYHGNDTLLRLNINHLSNRDLNVSFKLKDEIYKESYKKLKHFPQMVRTYSGIGSSTEKLLLLPSTKATFLKLSYKTLATIDEQEPIELIIEDQNSREIWRKNSFLHMM